MLKALGLLIIPFFLFANSIFTKSGKKVYKSISNTVKSSADVVRSNMNSSAKVDGTLPQEKRVTPKKREAFLKGQFIPKEKLVEVKKVKKEDINVDIDAIQFFDSLNSYTKKPIDIE